TGRWIVRAASTGISGIIAPDGRYVMTSALDTTAIVAGSVGAPVETVYDVLGTTTIALALGAIYLAVVALARFRRT
ncbi:MAG: apolipoprotein N-acyltransferase, partial [Candidatus Eremiobacteraeota bacterium]|nr:apolipoprotein N-acyltransferase [Candidatus Eremiobacteraeota bacterium]